MKRTTHKPKLYFGILHSDIVVRGYSHSFLQLWKCQTSCLVVLAYKTIEYLLKTSSANLFKPDRKQVADRTMNMSFIDYYLGWFLSLCKRVGRDEFPGRQFNKAL